VGLYFDFSGYSDMAVGLARMFGIRLPYNFDSPYRAASISDFWRRWHMTLSRFLRDYLYIPLGGNRNGPVRRDLNLMATMLLGGLWHGASWTFVVWGGLHGLYLLIDHGWRDHVQRNRRHALPRPVAHALTLLAVMFAWIFFASPDFASAVSVLAGITGHNGWLPEAKVVEVAGTVTQVDPVIVIRRAAPYAALAAGALLALFAPNSQQIVDGSAEVHPRPATRGWSLRLGFTPNAATGVLAAAAFLVAVSLMARVREFVYFQF
jgi:D-alanyl-lipoteichoic acid acyltransferase DltB (MBOAT superfamily)